MAVLSHPTKKHVPCQINVNMQSRPISAYFATYFVMLWSAYFEKKLPRFSDMPIWFLYSVVCRCSLAVHSSVIPRLGKIHRKDSKLCQLLSVELIISTSAVRSVDGRVLRAHTVRHPHVAGHISEENVQYFPVDNSADDVADHSVQYKPVSAAADHRRSGDQCFRSAKIAVSNRLGYRGG